MISFYQNRVQKQKKGNDLPKVDITFSAQSEENVCQFTATWKNTVSIMYLELTNLKYA